MRDPAKILVDTPPPLPRHGRPSARTAARLAAFAEIARLRAANGLRDLASWARRRPALAGLAGGTLALAILAGAAFALDLVPEPPFTRPSTVDEARERARSHPDDAAAQLELGHTLWVAGKGEPAFAAYGRALALRRDAADERLAADLIAAFGTKEQGAAEALIVKYRLAATEKGLAGLTRSPRPNVRWGAVRTLDRIGAGSKDHWETAYLEDLDSPRCEVRRRAVEKLGEIGTPRSIAALRSARAGDAKTGRSPKRRCLGDRLEKAEGRILARS
jgi:hypothetical protein